MADLPNEPALDPRIDAYLAAELDQAALDFQSIPLPVTRDGRRPVGALTVAAAAIVVVLLVVIGPRLLGILPATAGHPAGGLAHFDRDGLAFDYPAAWSVTTSGLNEHYITILDFLGTGSGSAGCTLITPGPLDQFISSTECGIDIKLDPGQVVVELSQQNGPPRVVIDPGLPTTGGGQRVTVGGLPAVASTNTDPRYGAEVALTWELSMPAQLYGSYSINAYLRGPGVEAQRAQVEALVASIVYDPPVPVLGPTKAADVLAAGIQSLKAGDPAYACFPTTPGASAQATVSQLPMYSPLRKPLPVTCTSAIEPTAIGLWKVTLTESWTAASDRSAGAMQSFLWLDADGTPGQEMGGPGPSEIPYWP